MKDTPGQSVSGETYLECERWRVFLLLMFVAGFYGAFTYSIRGGIFCNAQTANFVLFAMALGYEDWGQALYLLIPIFLFIFPYYSQSIVVLVFPVPTTFSCKERHVLHPTIPSAVSPLDL